MSTPFDAGGEVDPAAMRSNVSRWNDTGIRGVVALGSNGEAPLLDEKESDVVIAAARDALSGDRLLLAGTGRESTRGTIDASRRAASLGANAVLVRTPSYFKPRMTADAFVAHYTAVADGVPIPVLLYNYPAVTGLTLTVDAVARLARHPNIIGIKETSTRRGADCRLRGRVRGGGLRRARRIRSRVLRSALSRRAGRNPRCRVRRAADVRAPLRRVPGRAT